MSRSISFHSPPEDFVPITSVSLTTFFNPSSPIVAVSSLDENSYAVPSTSASKLSASAATKPFTSTETSLATGEARILPGTISTDSRSSSVVSATRVLIGTRTFFVAIPSLSLGIDLSLLDVKRDCGLFSKLSIQDKFLNSLTSEGSL